jgi:cell wall-associated NlpC family hydrolase
VAGSFVLMTAVTSASTALADPVIPSLGDIGAAKRAVVQRASAAVQIQAQLNSARADLDRTRIAAEAAGQRYDAALVRLAAAQAALRSAQRASRGARRAADAAQQDVGGLVRGQVQGDAGLLQWAILLNGASPQQIVEHASAFNSVSASLDGMLRRLERVRQMAAARETAANRAEQTVEAATHAAAASKVAAERAAATADRTVETYASRRGSLLVELAAAEHRSVTLVKQRQDGLEAQARARAEAARKAAEAALARREAARRAAEARAEAAARAQAEAAARAHADAAARAHAAAVARANAAAARIRADQHRRAQAALHPAAHRLQPTHPRTHSSRHRSSYRAAPVARQSSRHSAGSAWSAIAYARRQLGKPYVFGAAGPGAFDCSGLTLRAWQAAGVSLPRVASSQYLAIPHIGVGDLRPGDLVFWGASPGGIYHVAMYIGGGSIIQAPRPGRAVEISGLYDWIAPTYFGRP